MFNHLFLKKKVFNSIKNKQFFRNIISLSFTNLIKNNGNYGVDNNSTLTQFDKMFQIDKSQHVTSNKIFYLNDFVYSFSYKIFKKSVDYIHSFTLLLTQFFICKQQHADLYANQ